MAGSTTMTLAPVAKRATWLYAGLSLAVLAAVALNLGHGSLDIAWSELTRLLLDGRTEDPRGLVVWTNRAASE